MVADDTSPTKTVTGFLVGEQITLTVTPAGTTYAWSQAIPSGATAARSCLSDDSGASVTFTPDASGIFVLVCLVDGVTTYILRASVVNVASTTLEGSLLLQPLLDTQVPTPAVGATLYYSATQDAVSLKLTDGSVVLVSTEMPP